MTPLNCVNYAEKKIYNVDPGQMLMVGPEKAKFLSLSNDSELYWSYAQIIFPAGLADQGGHNKDATMAI